MTDRADTVLHTLQTILCELDAISIAVSGGVDSMTLSVVAGRALGERAEMFHAVSPAVPPQATDRVRRYADLEGWRLRIIDAGEFGDEDYMRNPVNRCFYCKTNLYGAVRAETSNTIASGTNLDDLGDYRPGLEAAAEHGVRHPFVEAGIDKETVRAIARILQLDDLAELPAAPCLSSRVETGIEIESAVLHAINAVELYLTRTVQPETVRCRVRGEGVVVELDAATLSALSDGQRVEIANHVRELCREVKHEQPVRFAPYRMGSAFVGASSGR